MAMLGSPAAAASWAERRILESEAAVTRSRVPIVAILDDGCWNSLFRGLGWMGCKAFFKKAQLSFVLAVSGKKSLDPET
jgi:hypothetical protein